MLGRRHRPIHYRPRHSRLGWSLALVVALGGAGVAAYWSYDSLGWLPSLNSGAGPAREPPRANLFTGPSQAEAATTLRFEAGAVTLLGIEPPGPNLTCASGDCGASARNMLGRIVGTRELLCIARSRSEGRTMVTCYLPDGSDVAASLVARGWAVAAPDTSTYRAEEERARSAAVGIWALSTAAADQAAPSGEGGAPATAAAPADAQPNDGGFVPPDD